MKVRGLNISADESPCEPQSRTPWTSKEFDRNSNAYLDATTSASIFKELSWILTYIRSMTLLDKQQVLYDNSSSHRAFLDQQQCYEAFFRPPTDATYFQYSHMFSN